MTEQDILTVLGPLVDQLRADQQAGPVAFIGTLESVTGNTTPYGVVGPFGTNLKDSMGNTLTLKLQSIPAVMKKPDGEFAIGWPFSFKYLKGSPVDQISNVALLATALGPALFANVLPPIPPSTEYTCIFMPLPLGSGQTILLKETNVPVAGMGPSLTTQVSFDYIPRADDQHDDVILAATVVMKPYP